MPKKEDKITLQFIRSCPDIGKNAGTVIEMSVQEYKAEALNVHPKTKDPLDARLNHTKIIGGVELLEEKKVEKKVEKKAHKRA